MVLGPEMTPYPPPRSSDSERIIFLPLSGRVPCFVLGDPLLTCTHMKRTPTRDYARWHFCTVNPRSTPPPPAKPRFKLAISGGQGRPSFVPPQGLSQSASGSVPSRRRGLPCGCPGPNRAPTLQRLKSSRRHRLWSGARFKSRPRP